jgi:hypothetical protein
LSMAWAMSPFWVGAFPPLIVSPLRRAAIFALIHPAS